MKQKVILLLLANAMATGLTGCASSYPGSASPQGISVTYDPWSDPLMIQEEMSRITRSLIP